MWEFSPSMLKPSLPHRNSTASVCLISPHAALKSNYLSMQSAYTRGFPAPFGRQLRYCSYSLGWMVIQSNCGNVTINLCSNWCLHFHGHEKEVQTGRGGERAGEISQKGTELGNVLLGQISLKHHGNIYSHRHSLLNRCDGQWGNKDVQCHVQWKWEYVKRMVEVAVQLKCGSSLSVAGGPQVNFPFTFSKTFQKITK